MTGCLGRRILIEDLCQVESICYLSLGFPMSVFSLKLHNTQQHKKCSVIKDEDRLTVIMRVTAARSFFLAKILFIF